VIPLTSRQAATLRPRLLPDGSGGRLVALHVVRTGNGACLADRWPDPRAILAECGGNYALTGEPEALTPAALRPSIAGFVDAPGRFEPLLREAFPEVRVWDRVVFELGTRPRYQTPPGVQVRRLEPHDAGRLRGLSPDLSWISKTWGGPEGLAASGHGWGAFAEGRLVSVACSFFVGDRYEELGVVTEEEFRGAGLNGACAGALCEDIAGRGRTPSWTTSPDNRASVRVARKLGFAFVRNDSLYVVGVGIPPPPRRPAPE
jgi:hypothetical protein